jgi:hypothetical protein
VAVVFGDGWFVVGRVAAQGRDRQAPRNDKRDAKGSDHSLRDDPRLRTRVSFDLKQPTVRQVLGRIQVATGVDLSIDPKVDLDKCSFGLLKVVNAPAWQVLEQVPRVKGAEGHWEKRAESYYLIANPAPAPAPRLLVSWDRRSVLLLVFAVNCLLLAGILLWVVIRKKLAVKVLE